jgi:hypothetical protein
MCLQDRARSESLIRLQDCVARSESLIRLQDWAPQACAAPFAADAGDSGEAQPAGCRWGCGSLSTAAVT